jgi:hypothetical protein
VQVPDRAQLPQLRAVFQSEEQTTPVEEAVVDSCYAVLNAVPCRRAVSLQLARALIQQVDNFALVVGFMREPTHCTDSPRRGSSVSTLVERG